MGGVLEDLANQTDHNFDVIVADSGSTDKTADVVHGFDDRLRLKFVEAPAKGVALARNTGAAAASGEYLLFLDADVRLPHSFIAALRHEARVKGFDVAACRTGTASRNPVDRFFTWVSYRYLRAVSRIQPVALGWCIVVRRDLHKRIDGFDARMNLGEDYDYVQRAAQAGGIFGWITSTVVLGSVRRYEQEGRIRLFLRTIGFEIHRLRHGGRIQPGAFTYEFGRHGAAPTGTEESRERPSKRPRGTV